MATGPSRTASAGQALRRSSCHSCSQRGVVGRPEPDACSQLGVKAMTNSQSENKGRPMFDKTKSMPVKRASSASCTRRPHTAGSAEMAAPPHVLCKVPALERTEFSFENYCRRNVPPSRARSSREANLRSAAQRSRGRRSGKHRHSSRSSLALTSCATTDTANSKRKEIDNAPNDDKSLIATQNSALSLISMVKLAGVDLLRLKGAVLQQALQVRHDEDWSNMTASAVWALGGAVARDCIAGHVLPFTCEASDMQACEECGSWQPSGLDGDALRNLATQFPPIVEAWDAKGIGRGCRLCGVIIVALANRKALQMQSTHEHCEKRWFNFLHRLESSQSSKKFEHVESSEAFELSRQLKDGVRGLIVRKKLSSAVDAIHQFRAKAAECAMTQNYDDKDAVLADADCLGPSAIAVLIRATADATNSLDMLVETIEYEMADAESWAHQERAPDWDSSLAAAARVPGAFDRINEEEGVEALLAVTMTASTTTTLAPQAKQASLDDALVPVISRLQALRACASEVRVQIDVVRSRIPARGQHGQKLFVPARVLCDVVLEALEEITSSIALASDDLHDVLDAKLVSQNYFQDAASAWATRWHDGNTTLKRSAKVLAESGPRLCRLPEAQSTPIGRALFVILRGLAAFGEESRVRDRFVQQLPNYLPLFNLSELS